MVKCTRAALKNQSCQQKNNHLSRNGGSLVNMNESEKRAKTKFGRGAKEKLGHCQTLAGIFLCPIKTLQSSYYPGQSPTTWEALRRRHEKFQTWWRLTIRWLLTEIRIIYKTLFSAKKGSVSENPVEHILSVVPATPDGYVFPLSSHSYNHSEVSGLWDVFRSLYLQFWLCYYFCSRILV